MAQLKKKIIKGWIMYDWANSVYTLIITTAIFPIFYNAVTSEKVLFFGKTFVNTELYSYVVSFSFILTAILSPLLSGMADYSGNKKRYMQFFCYLGALSCMSLFFFNAAHLEISMLSILFASVGFSGSLVFYNSYLPEIAPPKFHDKISAKGFAQGYIGSSILLIFCLILIQVFDVEAKYTFVITGVWWLGFSQYTFLRLPKNSKVKPPKKSNLKKGFQELRTVIQQLKNEKNIQQYLVAFFVYSMGVQTIMLMAVFFGTKEIAWASKSAMQTGLIISILMIQFIAIAGAHLMAYLSKKIGNIITLRIVVLIWAFICLFAFFVVYTPLQFYITAAIIGFVMGGIQSLSRSTYSKLIPKTTDNTSYFSFYDVLEKLGVVVGTFFFGFIEGIFSIRTSVLLLIVFFIVGFLLLQRVKQKRELRGSSL